MHESLSGTVAFSRERNFYNAMFTLYEEAFCLEAGNQCYEFEIKEHHDDGICCVSGIGYFKIYYDNILVEEGGEFFSSDTFKFGNACPVAVPSSSLQQPSVSLLSSSTSSSSKPSSGSWEALSETVSCNENQVEFRLELYTDYFPYEISWHLREDFLAGSVIFSRGELFLMLRSPSTWKPSVLKPTINATSLKSKTTMAME